MKAQSFNFEIKDLLTQFLAAFDDVVIKRYDSNRVAKETVEVRYVLGPKQRVMYDIVNKAQNLTLPVIAVNITGISRDASRVFHKLDPIYNQTGDTSRSQVLMPIPVNIEISMSILARYMQDMDQILSNFIPYNNPYIILSWKEPTNTPAQVVEIRSEVLWNGSISLNEPTDISYSDKFRVVADTSFTIKGWLFRNKNETANPIYFIDANFIATRGDMIITDSNYDAFFTSLSSSTETVSISALPTITNVFYSPSGNMIPLNNTYTINLSGSMPQNIILYGDNFTYTDCVLLSTNGTSSFTNRVSSINSTYTGSVSGYVLNSQYYEAVNDRIMTLNFDSLSGTGQFNIVVNNPVGWCGIKGFIFNKT